MPKKSPPTPEQQADFCAGLVIKAARDFKHLGVSVKKIGIPPPAASATNCRGHGVSDFCSVCYFNGCRLCGTYDIAKKPSFWSGRCCDPHVGMDRFKPHRDLVREILEVRKAELPVPGDDAVPEVSEAVAPEAAPAPPSPAVGKSVEKKKKGVEKDKKGIIKKKKDAKAHKISVPLDRPLTVGATSAKVVPNRRTGGWTLKLSVALV